MERHQLVVRVLKLIQELEMHLVVGFHIITNSEIMCSHVGLTKGAANARDFFPAGFFLTEVEARIRVQSPFPGFLLFIARRLEAIFANDAILLGFVAPMLACQTFFAIYTFIKAPGKWHNPWTSPSIERPKTM